MNRPNPYPCAYNPCEIAVNRCLCPGYGPFPDPRFPFRVSVSVAGLLPDSAAATAPDIISQSPSNRPEKSCLCAIRAPDISIINIHWLPAVWIPGPDNNPYTAS